MTAQKIGVNSVVVHPQPSVAQKNAADRYAQKKAVGLYQDHQTKDEARTASNQWAMYFARWFRKRGFEVTFRRKYINYQTSQGAEK